MVLQDFCSVTDGLGVPGPFATAELSPSGSCSPWVSSPPAGSPRPRVPSVTVLALPGVCPPAQGLRHRPAVASCAVSRVLPANDPSLCPLLMCSSWLCALVYRTESSVQRHIFLSPGQRSDGAVETHRVSPPVAPPGRSLEAPPPRGSHLFKELLPADAGPGWKPCSAPASWVWTPACPQRLLSRDRVPFPLLKTAN